MDWMAFVAALVAALAWPITLLITLLVLRKPIVDLIALVGTLRYKDLEVEFTRKLDAAASEASALPAPDAARQAIEADRSDVLELAQYSPRAAILEAWIGLEQAAKEAAKRNETDFDKALLRSPIKLVDLLEQESIIDARQAALMHELRNLRNAAAHAMNFEPRTDEAVRYVNIATRLEASLQDG